MQKTENYKIEALFSSRVDRHQIVSGMEGVTPQLTALWARTVGQSSQPSMEVNPEKGLLHIVFPAPISTSCFKDINQILCRAFGGSDISMMWPSALLLFSRGNWLPPPPERLTEGCSHAGANIYRNSRVYGLQDGFRAWFKRTVVETTDSIKKEPKFSLWDLLQDIGRKRREIAIGLKQQGALEYGEPRPLQGSSCYLTCMDYTNYPDYYDRFNRDFSSGQCKKWSEVSKHFEQKVFLGMGLGGSCFVIEHPLSHKVEPSILTTICAGSVLNESTPVILHTRGITETDKQQTLMYLEQRISSLFSKGSPCTKDETLKILAEVHWWLAQLMFFKRGSAAISEIFMQAVAKVVGFPHSSWAPKIMPDIEAMYRPLQEFIEVYPRILYLREA